MRTEANNIADFLVKKPEPDNKVEKLSLFLLKKVKVKEMVAHAIKELHVFEDPPVKMTFRTAEQMVAEVENKRKLESVKMLQQLAVYDRHRPRDWVRYKSKRRLDKPKI